MENSAADIQKQIDQLKQQTALLDAQKTAVESKKALFDAQKSLAEAQKQADASKPNSTAQQVGDLQSQKSLVDAQKALFDSQAQATLAKYIGDVKQGPYSGTVNIKNDKAGTEEALLLAAQAVKAAAQRIADAVREKADVFYLFTASQLPNFQRLIGFRFRVRLMNTAFQTVQPASQQSVDVKRAELLTPGLVSAGLDATVKLLDFFKTDYDVGGIDAKLDDALLLFSVAGALRRDADPKRQVAAKTAKLPFVYGPAALEVALTEILKDLEPLAEFRVAAESQANQLQNDISDADKRAADPANSETKDQILATSAALKLRLDHLNAVAALYDTFATSLSTPDPSGGLPISEIAQELAIERALAAGGAVLLLRLENSGGGYLLKKNLWTGLGSMPLYHMGGATVAYVLLSGTDGAVIAGEVLPVYGGFVKSDALQSTLDGHA